MPVRIPKYRKRADRNIGFAERPRGRRVYFPGQYDSPESKAAYNRWLRATLGEAEAGVTLPVNPGCTSIADLVLAFLDWAKLYYLRDGKAGSEYHCLRAASIPLLKTADCVLVQRFGPKDLKAVRSDMIARGWTRETINDQIGRVRRIFKWGVEHELVNEMVWRTLQAVAPLGKGRTAAPESRGVQPVDNAIVAATVSKLSPTVAAMVQIQEASGMRPQDVCGIRPADVDRSDDVWIYRPAVHKGDWRKGAAAERMIALGPRAQKILRPWLDRDPHAYCFSPAESEAARRTARGRGKRHGGALDGLAIQVPVDIEIPAELVFREDEIAPGWDAIYRRRAKNTFEIPLVLDFDYRGDTEGRRNELWYRQQFQWRDEEILRLRARLMRQAKWLARLRGTIKGMQSRTAKKRTAPRRRGPPET